MPLGTRIRVRLCLEPVAFDELAACVEPPIAQAGNLTLMTHELIVTLAEHAAGNCRILMTMANELLDVAAQHKLKQLDDKLTSMSSPPHPDPDRNEQGAPPEPPSIK